MSVSNLILDIKRKAQLGQNQQTITNADIVDLANRELQTYLTPKLIAVQERYFAAFAEYTITPNRRRYRIPARCIGGRVLDVVLVQSGIEYRLPRLHPTSDVRLDPGFIISGRDIVLCGDVLSGVLRIYYQLRPSTLVEAATSFAISAVSSSNIASTAPAGTFDVVATSGLGQIAIPNAISSGSSVMTGSSDWVLPQDLTNFAYVGDVAKTAGQTNIVPLPLELHDVLAFRCAMRLKQMQGLNEEMQVIASMTEQLERNAFDLITPRSENAEKSIDPKDLLGGWY
jgi:hypothetical protein